MRTKWSILDVILVFVFLIILMGITSAYSDKIRGIFDSTVVLGMEPRLTLFFLSALLQAIFIITVVWLLALFRKISFRDTGFTLNSFGNILYMGFGGGIVLFIVVVTLGIVITLVSRTVPPPQEVATYLIAMEGTGPRILAFFLSSVMAPLSEELYFRGMVYPVFRDKVGRNAAMLISGLLFSLAHRDLFRFIPIAVGGIGLALLYERSKSLWTPIIAHSTWNTIMMVLMLASARFLP